VLFYPDHLQLVKGGPGERRLFLNIAISQLDPLYLRALSKYEKLLQNRNSLLKMAQKGGYFDRDLILAYSEGMAAEAETIFAARQGYIEKLNGEAGALLRALSGEREQLALTYEADVPEGTKEAYMRRFSDTLDREVAAGCTLFGVQRDEMAIAINGREARTYASQGQARSVVLALKLGEGEAARQMSGEYPVFLFDDVLSELDEGRRAFILGDAGRRQVIMTSCERRGFEGIAANEICVKSGVYE
jgi:DNA replication and repair protein RecF